MRAHSLGAFQELRALEAETVEKERTIHCKIPDLKRQFDEIKAKIENRLAIVVSTSQQTNDLVQNMELELPDSAFGESALPQAS
jgi:hypothetical protein